MKRMLSHIESGQGHISKHCPIQRILVMYLICWWQGTLTFSAYTTNSSPCFWTSKTQSWKSNKTDERSSENCQCCFEYLEQWSRWSELDLNRSIACDFDRVMEYVDWVNFGTITRDKNENEIQRPHTVYTWTTPKCRKNIYWLPVPYNDPWSCKLSLRKVSLYLWQMRCGQICILLT